MNTYDDIYCLADFGMLAGGYKVLYVDCTDTEGKPIYLADTSSFGCRFYYYGTTDLVFDLGGIISDDFPYRMKLELKSALTQNLGSCCLEYMPYVVRGENTIKFGKGRIVIEGD